MNMILICMHICYAHDFKYAYHNMYSLDYICFAFGKKHIGVFPAFRCGPGQEPLEEFLQEFLIKLHHAIRNSLTGSQNSDSSQQICRAFPLPSANQIKDGVLEKHHSYPFTHTYIHTHIYIWLVVWNPSEKYESMGRIIPYIYYIMEILYIHYGK